MDEEKDEDIMIIMLKYLWAYSDDRYIHLNTRETRQATKDMNCILKKEEKRQRNGR